MSGFTAEHSNAVRRAMRANTITKARATAIRMHTRDQGEPATKAAVLEATNEVKKLRHVVYQLFNALAEKQEMNFKRWNGFREEWIKSKDTVKKGKRATGNY